MKQINQAIILVIVCVLFFPVFPASSQEGCDGPVWISPYSQSQCACVGAGCSGNGSASINGYFRCGGSGYLYCYAGDSTVGTRRPCLSDTPEILIINCSANHPNDGPCCYTICALGDATPIHANVAFIWGGYCPF